MPNPEVIRAQTTPQDGPLFTSGYANSKFVVQEHIVFSEEIRQKGVAEIANARAGSSITYGFEKTCTLLEDVELEVTPPALTGAGGATYIRYTDDLGDAMIEEVTWMYGANTIQSYKMDTMFLDRQLLMNESRDNQNKLVAADLSAAARNTYAVAPKKLRIRIPAPWNDLKSHCPIISALSNKLTLTIRFAQPSAIVQTNGTKPAALAYDDARLVFQQIHFTGKTRAEVTSLTEMTEGLSYLYNDVIQYDYEIPANALRANGAAFTIQLPDFDGPIHIMQSLLRTTTQLDATTANVAPYEIDTTYMEGLSYQMLSNNMNMLDLEEQDYDGVRKTEKYWQCRFDTQQIVFLWSEFPKMLNCDSGHLSFGNFQLPRLQLYNSSLGGVHPALRLTIVAKRQNWQNQQRGTYQKVWR